MENQSKKMVQIVYEPWMKNWERTLRYLKSMKFR